MNQAKREQTSLASIFGKRMAVVRKSRQMTQYELADKIGLPRNTISYYESRAKNPTLEVLQKVSQCLDVDPRELISEPEEANKKNGPDSKLDVMVKKIKDMSPFKQRIIINAVEAMINSK